MDRCLLAVISIPVLAMCGTLLGVRITGLTGDDAAFAHLDGGQFQWEAIATTVYGSAGLLLLPLAICGLVGRSWKLLLVGLLLLAGMFVAVRFDDIAGRPAGGDLDEITAAMNSSIGSYGDDPDVRRAWDFVQKKLHCCGGTNGSDWTPEFGAGHVPDSCCGPNAANCSAVDGAYKEGCVLTVQRFIGHDRAWSVAVATAVASLLLLLFIGGPLCGCCGGSGSDSSGSSPISSMTKAALDNRANQLNPNNWRFQGRR